MSVIDDVRVPMDMARNLVDPKAYADWDIIHSTYSALRRSIPVGRVEYPGFDPFWAVTLHADIQHVSRNNEIFHNNGNRAGLSSKSSFAAQDAMADRVPPIRSLVAIDGLDHRQLRAVTAKWFMPKHIRGLEDQIRIIARNAISKARDHGGQVDFVRDVALGYPLSVIRTILGVPESDEPVLLRMTQEFFAPNDPDFAADGTVSDDLSSGKATSTEALAAFMEYFANLTASRRAHPTGDVASIIANAEIDGAIIDDWDATSYYITVATAGHDTTSASTAGALWALCERPDVLAEMKADPSLIPGMVDEAIRWTTPIQHFMRTAITDTEVGGQPISAGDWLMLCYPSGNRDEAVFPNPFDFNPHRPQGKHVAFGYGGHLCLGMHLAKLEMRVFFEELLAVIDTVEFAGAPRRTASLFIGGPKSLPVRMTFR